MSSGGGRWGWGGRGMLMNKVTGFSVWSIGLPVYNTQIHWVDLIYFII